MERESEGGGGVRFVDTKVNVNAIKNVRNEKPKKRINEWKKSPKCGSLFEVFNCHLRLK